jgi:ATP-dependent DNA helicase RecG
MRPPSLNRWFTSLVHLKGVGEATYSHLRRLLRREGVGEVARIRDLMFHLPVEVLDRRNHQFQTDAVVTLKVVVKQHESPASNRKALPYKVITQCESHSLTLVFFNSKGDYLERQLPIGQERVVSGKLEQTGRGWQMVHPDAIGMPAQYAEIAKLEPIYPLTYALTQRRLGQMMQTAMKLLTPLPEWQDAAWLKHCSRARLNRNFRQSPMGLASAWPRCAILPSKWAAMSG